VRAPGADPFLDISLRGLCVVHRGTAAVQFSQPYEFSVHRARTRAFLRTPVLPLVGDGRPASATPAALGIHYLASQ